MARNIFTKGTAITLAWHFTKPDGSSFDLSGYQLRLFYGVGSRYTEVSGFSLGTNATSGFEDFISWVFAADKQFTAGDYKMKLQLYQNGKLFTTFNYNDAFALYQGTPYSNNDEQQTEEVGVVNLYTAAEFYLFNPIIPVVGSDGFWYVNGVLVRDGNIDPETGKGHPIPSYYDVRYDEDTRWLSIYKGNPDDPGTPEPEPIQVIKDVDDALKHWNEQYLAEEGSLAESEAGDDDRWGQYKMNEGTLDGSEAGDSDRWGQYQSSEATRDAEYAAAEGTSSSSSSQDSRWGKYKAAESTRNVQYTQQEGSKAGSSAGGSDRWGQYKAAEAARDAERLAAEGNSSASATDNTRWGKYKAAENARDAARLAVEGNSDSAKDNTTRWGAYKLAEDARDEARETAEGSATSTAGDASRWGKFKEQEGTLDSSEADDGSRWGQYKEEEGTEDSSYTEHSRWGNYQAAEITRGNDYSEAEGSADGSTSGDGSRWGSYKLQEGANTDDASASGSRWARYKNAEESRGSDYTAAEAARDALYAAAEAARDEAIAPAIGIYDCDTAAATADKTVSASDYILASGGAIKIKFQYANSAASPTLEINSQGAKAIVFNGAVASASNTWGAGEVVEFYYDPTYNSNAGGYIGRSMVVSVSQNTETGHTDINIGGVANPVPSVKDMANSEKVLSMLCNILALGDSYKSYCYGAINMYGKWTNTDVNHQHRLYPISQGDVIKLTTGSNVSQYCFLSDIPIPVENETANLLPGSTLQYVDATSSVTITATEDCYLYVSYSYQGVSTAFSSIEINGINIAEGWLNFVNAASQVPVINTKIGVLDSELEDIGVFRIAKTGTPKNMLITTPVTRGGYYLINLKLGSGEFKGNFRAYNGDTLLGAYSLSVGDNNIELPANTNKTIWFIGSTSTAVNPILTITSKSGILFEDITALDNKIALKQSIAEADAQAKSLLQYVLRFKGNEGGGNPIDKIPSGVYGVSINVASGTLAAKLNGYDASNNLVFSYDIVESNSKELPDCDHMKVSILGTNTATDIVIRYTSYGSVLYDSSVEHNVPPYVFTIDNGVRIPAIIYQEGIDKKGSNETLNGGVGLVLNPTMGTDYRTLRIESKNDRKDYTVNQKAQDATTDVSGVRILSIGDSLTAGRCKNPLTDSYDKWGNWTSYMLYLSLIHNKDNECGVITQLGTKQYPLNFEYGSQQFSSKTFFEAVAGWAAANYLNHALVIKTRSESAATFGTSDGWYLLGLATKTPYDASSYNPDVEDWSGTNEQLALLQTTPMGRYKIDHCEAIWNKIKVIDTTFHQGESWTGTTTQKEAVDAWVLNKMNNPDNPFFSLEQARAYSGEYVWTYEYAMSLDKYLERYRTMDDYGNRLYFDANQSTIGTAGIGNLGYLADGTVTEYYIGTEVSDTTAYNVCRPTHVIVALGTNGGYTEANLNCIDNILTLMKAEASYVAYQIPRFDNGVFNSGRWRGVVPYEITQNMENYDINRYFMNKYAGNISNTSLIQYIPSYITQCPYSSVLDTYAIDDLGNKIYCQSNADGHIGWLAQRDIGLQAYGWLLNSLM